MKTTLIYTLALASLYGSTQVFAADGERLLTLQEDVAAAELIRLDIPSGDVEVIGTSGNRLTAQMTATCEDEGREACQKQLEQLDWAKKAGNTFELGLSPAGVTNYNHMNMKIKIGVPRDKSLDVSLSAGALRISDSSACVTASVIAGEIDLRLAANQLTAAALSAKVGDVKLTNPKGDTLSGERSLLVGANLDWKNPNSARASCRVNASVLTGEARLTVK
jgi:hypothetical protein